MSREDAYRRIVEISAGLKRTDEETRFGSDGRRTDATPGKRALLKQAGISKNLPLAWHSIVQFSASEAAKPGDVGREQLALPAEVERMVEGAQRAQRVVRNVPFRGRLEG